MRRLSDFRTRSTKRVSVAPKASRERMSPNNDIIYLLSRLSSSINMLHNCISSDGSPYIDILNPWKKSYERKLFYRAGAAFEVELHPFVNLRSLKIEEAEEFDMCRTNGTATTELELCNVGRVFLSSELEDVSLRCMCLRGVKISLQHLLKIIGTENLLSIVINRIEIAETADWMPGLLEGIRRMKSLKSLEISHMGMDPQCFHDLCKALDLASFKMVDENICVDASSSGPIRFKNILEIFRGYGFELAESICIIGTDIRHAVGMSLPSLRSMQFCSAIIDIGIFRSLLVKQSTIEELGFIRCVFDHLSFYEIVLHFRTALRRLNLRSSILPHDYLCFLSSKLSFCTVILVDGAVRTINNTAPQRVA
jgi:hypothetical protein